MKLPNNAKRVFKGMLFDTYQWPQEMFDGSVETFEGLKRNDSTAIIAIKDDKILVSMEEQPGSKPFLGIPCGFIDEGENPLSSAKREFREETGLVSDEWELYKVFPVDTKIQWDTHVFIARNCKKEGEPKLDVGGEKIETKWISFDEFLDFVVDDRFRLINLAMHIMRMRFQQDKLDEFRVKLFKN